MNTITKRVDTAATIHGIKKSLGGASYFTSIINTSTTTSRSGSTSSTTTRIQTKRFASLTKMLPSSWCSYSSCSVSAQQHQKPKFSLSLPRRKGMNRGITNGATSTTSSNSNRRRRRKTAATGNGVDANSVPSESSSTAVHDPKVFASAANSFLNKVQNAIEPMKAHNEVFNIVRSQNQDGENLTIRLKPSEGQYVFQVYKDMTRLTMVSPMSGSFTYVLCSRTGQFVGMDDGHICEGMLVRDLIRHCNGMPQF
jgi:hypothetical protein